jgi:acyl-CoA dehydrogenase
MQRSLVCGYRVGYLCFDHPFHSTLGFRVSAAPWQEFHREEESSTSEKNQGKFVPSEKVMQLRKKLIKFIEDHIYPMEGEFYKHAQSTSRWTIHPEEENIKALAKKEGLWNLFIPVCFFAL